MPRGGQNNQGYNRNRNSGQNRNQGQQKGPLLYFFDRRQSIEGAKKETVKGTEVYTVKTRFKVATTEEKIVRFAINDTFLPDDTTTSAKEGTYTFHLPIGFSQADLKIYLIGDTKERDTLHVVEDELGQTKAAQTPTDKVDVSVTATDIQGPPSLQFVAHVHILVNGKPEKRTGKLYVEKIGEYDIDAGNHGHEAIRVPIPSDFGDRKVRFWAIDQSGKKSKPVEFDLPILKPDIQHLFVDADVNEDKKGMFYVKIRTVNDNQLPMASTISADADVKLLIVNIDTQGLLSHARFSKLTVPATGALPVLVNFEGNMAKVKLSLDGTAEVKNILFVKRRRS